MSHVTQFTILQLHLIMIYSVGVWCWCYSSWLWISIRERWFCRSCYKCRDTIYWS